MRRQNQGGGEGEGTGRLVKGEGGRAGAERWVKYSREESEGPSMDMNSAAYRSQTYNYKSRATNSYVGSSC